MIWPTVRFMKGQVERLSYIYVMSGALGSPNHLITTLDEDGLQELYTWIDEINLSRPKRNIWRDFSDGGRYHVLFFIGFL